MVYIFVIVFMKSTKKYKRILFLMIISQLLLTAFVVQWLRSQYNEEKERLQLDLVTLYMDAQDEMVDTLLFRSYVSPVLTQSDSLQSSITGFMYPEDKKRSISVRINRQVDSVHLSHDTLRIRRTDEDMLLRSVKLIISHSKDSMHADRQVIRNLNITPDTTAFKVHFNERLDGAGLNFNLVWKEDSLSGRQMKRTLLLAPHSPFSLPPVSVGDYDRYLIGKLWPQILFGVVLICLTALAFFLSYRSLRDHVTLSMLRNEFISNMTHELKTPVATIGLALESLGKFNMKNEPEVMEEYLGLALSETKRLEHLVSRVLDHSMLEENMRSVELVESDLNALISEVAAIMHPRLAGGGKIKIIGHEGGIRVKCDPLLLKGVIINLVDNSIKYCDKTPEILIRSMVEGNSARIEVQDNGPGIPAEYKQKIFEKFFRVPSGNVHNVKGYGLGLSYASLVMKLHKGCIEAGSCESGCTMILKLPLHHG